jgi:OmpA-OmpF porin, OOP family
MYARLLVIIPVLTLIGSGVADSAKAQNAPGQGAWANYDFVPGERALFADDFSRDNVGDFPRRLEFVQGNLELVEWQGQRLLRLNSKEGEFRLRLPESLPERFTIEFDFHSTGPWAILNVVPAPGTNFGMRYPHTYVQVSGPYALYGMESGERGTGLARGVDASGPKALQPTDRILQGIVPVRIMANGSYMKVFVEEQRVANIPNTDFQRSDALRFLWHLGNAPEMPAIYIGNFRIAAGGRKLYDALAELGRASTQGILFDTGSDHIRPESTPTLREIGEMLRQHSDLRLLIEGHTDSVGDAAANQSLSDKRAAAVKQYLVSTYGVDAVRLESRGLGATRPIAPNDTSEGRQNNRRVELVRL